MSPKQLNLEILSGLQDCSFFVWRYRASHSRLVIKINCGDIVEGDVFYLVMTSVLYFSGPMIWSGHTFRLGTKEEIAQLYRTLTKTMNSPEDNIIENNDYLLLIFEGACQILCGGVTAHDEFPGE